MSVNRFTFQFIPKCDACFLFATLEMCFVFIIQPVLVQIAKSPGKRRIPVFCKNMLSLRNAHKRKTRALLTDFPAEEMCEIPFSEYMDVVSSATDLMSMGEHRPARGWWHGQAPSQSL